MASWEDEDFEPSYAPGAPVDKWDGEDEDDDDIKDCWDADEEEEKKEVPQSQPKKKKTLEEKVKEREEKKRKEALAKQAEMNATKELTPEEELEEKLRQQRLQEESDLEIAKDAFGVVDLAVPGQRTIDNFMPANKEEFTELANMIVQKLTKFELRTDYPLFLETLIRDVCAGCEAEEIRKISNTLNLLVQAKQKENKVANKGKKKTPATGKKTLASGKGIKDDLDYDGGYYDLNNEFDDFM